MVHVLDVGGSSPEASGFEAVLASALALAGRRRVTSADIGGGVGLAPCAFLQPAQAVYTGTAGSEHERPEHHGGARLRALQALLRSQPGSCATCWPWAPGAGGPVAWRAYMYAIWWKSASGSPTRTTKEGPGAGS